MGERNTQGRCLEAATVASLSVYEASTRQIFSTCEEHSKSKSTERFVIPAVKASSAAAGKPIKNQGTAETL